MKPAVLNIFGLSGGKDSTALMLWAINESGYSPESLVFTWCDTGNEHPYTVNYIRYLSTKLRRIKHLIPTYKGEETDFFKLARQKGRFPSAKARFCTEVLKIVPSQKYVTGLQARGFDILIHVGVRAGESSDRAKLTAREWNELYDCEVYRPLLSWSKADVFATHDRYGVPSNPLYGKHPRLPWNGEPNRYYGDGAERVGCYPCIMSRKAEIARIARNEPGIIDRIAVAERSVASGDGTRLASFFSPNKIPVRLRGDVQWPNKQGRMVALSMISDVVSWAKSGTVEQYRFWFGEEDERTDEPLSCASKWGLCE